MSTRLWVDLRRWIDSGADDPGSIPGNERLIDWVRVVPFALLHLGCLAVVFVGTSTLAVWVAIASYAIRMFAITAFYHRYFAHRAFKASRSMQFVFAVLGASAVQRGPLWWASHHRHHHRHADDPADRHSAKQHGLLWSHCGWFLARGAFRTNIDLVRDFASFPELRWLDRFDVIVPTIVAAAMYVIGEGLASHCPALGTDGMQLLVWGFCIPTVVLYHSTFSINSLAHRWGSRRFNTRDDSRNSFWLALLTFGEGWHNNHHHFPGAARQGFRWFEIDITYYGLRVLAALGVIRGLRAVPERLRSAYGRPDKAGGS